MFGAERERHFAEVAQEYTLAEVRKIIAGMQADGLPAELAPDAGQSKSPWIVVKSSDPEVGTIKQRIDKWLKDHNISGMAVGVSQTEQADPSKLSKPSKLNYAQDAADQIRRRNRFGAA